MTATITIPAFDPDTADEMILQSAESVRRLRALGYRYDDAPTDDWSDAALDRFDRDKAAAEAGVEGNVATTIPGVVARLLLLIPQIDQDRWVDRTLVEGGFTALYAQVGRLSHQAQQTMYAVNELLHIEWEQNLAAYERSSDDFDLALTGKTIIDEAWFSGELTSWAQAMRDHIDRCADRFSNVKDIRRLVRTLTPDHAAFQRKIEVIIKERWSENEDPAPWLARDTAFLVGRISAVDVGEQADG